MKLNILPERGPADAPLFITISDIGPGMEATLTATAEDARGMKWASAARFKADSKGRVELIRSAPLGDTPYRGVEPLGMITSMTPEDPDHTASFQAPWNGFEVEFLCVAGAETVRKTAFREIAGPDARRVEVEDDGLRGVLFEPAGTDPCPGIVFFYGGEGDPETDRGEMESTAGLLASRGYMVLCPEWFEGIAPRETPLEDSAAAMVFMDEHPRVADGRVSILAGGTGAEGAAGMCAYIDVRPACLILLSPSNVFWSDAEGKGSKWSLDGEPLPYLSPGSLAGQRMISGFRKIMGGKEGPTPERSAYASALKNEERAEAARIPVEEIEAPILLMAGREDRMRPCPDMARAIKDRRKDVFAGKHDRIAFYDLDHMAPCIPGLPAEDGKSLNIAKAWSGLLTFLKECAG